MLQGFQHGQTEQALTVLQKQLRSVDYHQWIPTKVLSGNTLSRRTARSPRANLATTTNLNHRKILAIKTRKVMLCNASLILKISTCWTYSRL
ncbi:hypothetical protein AB4259_10735 [Vibrio amylolyticus]|uniref:hypothetical protein n=1 Tax=Vibrio amylolyticus TaxID=2847292 RepID=UPI00354CF57E